MFTLCIGRYLHQCLHCAVLDVSKDRKRISTTDDEENLILNDRVVKAWTFLFLSFYLNTDKHIVIGVSARSLITP